MCATILCIDLIIHIHIDLEMMCKHPCEAYEPKIKPLAEVVELPRYLAELFYGGHVIT